jgi:hypothetical protein
MNIFNEKYFSPTQVQNLSVGQQLTIGFPDPRFDEVLSSSNAIVN